MSRKHSCPICSKAFTTTAAVIEHIKHEHSNKLSQQSFEYLRSLGVSVERIIEFCRSNGVEIGFQGQSSLLRWGVV